MFVLCAVYSLIWFDMQLLIMYERWRFALSETSNRHKITHFHCCRRIQNTFSLKILFKSIKNWNHSPKTIFQSFHIKFAKLNELTRCETQPAADSDVILAKEKYENSHGNIYFVGKMEIGNKIGRKIAKLILGKTLLSRSWNVQIWLRTISVCEPITNLYSATAALLTWTCTLLLLFSIS